MTTDRRVERLEKQVARLQFQLRNLSGGEVGKFLVNNDVGEDEYNEIHDVFEKHDKVLKETGTLDVKVFESDLEAVIKFEPAPITSDGMREGRENFTPGDIICPMIHDLCWKKVCEAWLRG